jgi:hypothetical protein
MRETYRGLEMIGILSILRSHGVLNRVRYCGIVASVAGGAGEWWRGMFDAHGQWLCDGVCGSI